jgi:hypothetical protein
MIDISPMYCGTLAFLAFSSCFIIPGLFLIHSLKNYVNIAAAAWHSTC